MFLNLYPNVPTWLTPFSVMGSWLVIAAIGAIGYWLFRKGLTVIGLGDFAWF